MTYTDRVKDELTHLECAWECCARAEICAAILLSGGLSFRGRGKYGLSITVRRVAASRYYFSLIKKRLGVTCEIRASKRDGLGEQTSVELVFPQDTVDAAMREMMLYDSDGLFGIASRPAKEITANPCCKAAFLKSAFLITGYVSNPEREYSLTLSCSSQEAAESIRDIMLEKGLKAHVSPRRSKFVVYVKEAESISAFLTLIGAHAATLEMENVRIMKELRNRTNRLTNCDSGNIERTVGSSATQRADIVYLAENMGMDKLPPWAREIASLRLENPDAPLSELGEMCDPPIGKSGVNNRLRRLSQMARRVREDKGEILS